MNICILTMVKDEQDYLGDFLDYHTRMGIDVHIFEDVFSHSHQEICDKYKNVFLHSLRELYSEDEQDELTQNRLERKPNQTEFINRGLKYIHSLGKYDWCWLTDVDEFITCTEPMEDILERFKDRDAVMVYWLNYGASGHLYKPQYDRPIWEIFTKECGYEQKRDAKLHNITKFCVNMRKYNPYKRWHIHNASVNWVKADGTVKRGIYCFEPMYLRHYTIKSIEEYIWKVHIRGMHHNGHRDFQSLREMDGESYEMAKNDKQFCKYIKDKYNVEIC